MLRPEDIISINGPTVDIYQSDLEMNIRFSSGLIYSVQLADGLVVTSPEKFPNDPQTQQAPKQP